MKIYVSSGRNSNTTKNFTFDSSSTYQFGDVQPVMCMELESKSKISVRQNSIVRLGILNCPTFGRIKYATFGRFVPITDLYRPFENLLSQQAFSTGDSTYVPQYVPSCPLGYLSSFLLYHLFSDVSVYKKSSDTYTLQTTSAIEDIYNYIIEKMGFDYSARPRTYTVTNTSDFSFIKPSEYNPSIHRQANILVSPSAADFMFNFTISSSDYPNLNGSYLLCYRLNALGKRLYKIFVGCGYQFDLQGADTVSILPLLAFYKAYFDLFKPLNSASGNITYDNTTAYKLQEVIVHRNVTDVSYNDSDPDLSIVGVNSFFADFISDLALNTTYYQKTDFVTSHISQPSLSKQLRPRVSNPSTLADYQGAGANSDGTMPTLPGTTTGNTGAQYTTAWNVRLLLKLLPYFNKNTVVGVNIQKWLKVHGFGDLVQNIKSYSCGKYEVPCSITDINSNADTFDSTTGQGEALGAYAGKGIGVTDGKGGEFKYCSDTQGFFIILATIIPVSRYSQGVNPSIYHRSKLEFFNSEFDALDFQVSRKSIVKCGSDVLNTFTLNDNTTSLPASPYSSSFGFIPRYSEYCYLPNIVNGNMALRSTRNTFLPYTLDKYIQDYNAIIKPSSESVYTINFKFPSTGTNVPVATPELRNLGNSLRGNYDRIFADSFIHSRTFSLFQDDNAYVQDNFIVHNQFDVSYSSGKKSLSMSFETQDGGSDVSIDKE